MIYCLVFMILILTSYCFVLQVLLIILEQETDFALLRFFANLQLLTELQENLLFEIEVNHFMFTLTVEY